MMYARAILVCFYVEIVISAVTVDRQAQDIVYVDSNDCNKIYGQKKSYNSHCICSRTRKKYVRQQLSPQNVFPKYTFMSKSGEYTKCNGPEDLHCYTRLDSKKPSTYLIKHKNTDISVSTCGYDQFCDSVTQILVWNMNDDKATGRWHPLPDDLVKKLFKVLLYRSDNYGDNYKGTLSVSHIDLKVWSGHLIKVSFGYGEYKTKEACATIKIEGEVQYPFDWETFIKEVREKKDPTPSKKTMRLLLILIPLIPIAFTIILYHIGLFGDLFRKRERSGNELLIDNQEQENCDGDGDVIDMTETNDELYIIIPIYTGMPNNNQDESHNEISDYYGRNDADPPPYTEEEDDNEADPPPYTEEEEDNEADPPPYTEEDNDAYQPSEVGETRSDYETILRRCDDIIAHSLACNASTGTACAPLHNNYGDAMTV